jgi:hypothetical protein
MSWRFSRGADVAADVNVMLTPPYDAKAVAATTTTPRPPLWTACADTALPRTACSVSSSCPAPAKTAGAVAPALATTAVTAMVTALGVHLF